MTSNLASEEIANHALELRREAKEAAEHREEGTMTNSRLFALEVFTKDLQLMNDQSREGNCVK